MIKSQMETRNDILVYTTEAFKEGIEVSGFIETIPYVSSDVKDTDFTIKLIDVYPDGRAFNLMKQYFALVIESGFDKEVFMKKGEVYQLDLSAMSTSNYFAPGHRVSEIASSNFPRFDRNLNTGGNNYDESQGVQAHNMLHHSTEYPSNPSTGIMKTTASPSKE